ncbi:hypothetical protein HDU67_002101 [Dinochytrium kinnereticum]|nr:hypothetical protein HDU67_002101 [Dinochytrium kinnereticum]
MVAPDNVHILEVCVGRASRSDVDRQRDAAAASYANLQTFFLVTGHPVCDHNVTEYLASITNPLKRPRYLSLAECARRGIALSDAASPEHKNEYRRLVQDKASRDSQSRAAGEARRQAQRAAPSSGTTPYPTNLSYNASGARTAARLVGPPPSSKGKARAPEYEPAPVGTTSWQRTSTVNALIADEVDTDDIDTQESPESPGSIDSQPPSHAACWFAGHSRVPTFVDSVSPVTTNPRSPPSGGTPAPRPVDPAPSAADRHATEPLFSPTPDPVPPNPPVPSPPRPVADAPPPESTPVLPRTTATRSETEPDTYLHQVHRPTDWSLLPAKAHREIYRRIADNCALHDPNVKLDDDRNPNFNKKCFRLQAVSRAQKRLVQLREETLGQALTLRGDLQFARQAGTLPSDVTIPSIPSPDLSDPEYDSTLRHLVSVYQANLPHVTAAREAAKASASGPPPPPNDEDTPMSG